MVSQGILNMRVFDILNSHEFTQQESVLKEFMESWDIIQEQDWDGGNYPAREGLKLQLDHGELDEQGEWFCLLTKLLGVQGIGGVDLMQLEAAVHLFLERIYSNNTDIASGTKIILKIVGPWEAFESKVLAYLKQEGLKRISKVIHSNRGEGMINLGPIQWVNRGKESDDSTGGQGFLTILTKAPIPTQLANSLYVVIINEMSINELKTNIKTFSPALQIEWWCEQLNWHIQEYNDRSRMEYDQLDPDRFSTYFSKFKTEIASQKEGRKTNNPIFDPPLRKCDLLSFFS